MAGCRERISIRVSLIVEAVDEFYGRPVSGGGLRVWIEGARPAAVKAGGYYVFLNLPGERAILHVEGPQFYPQRMELDEKMLARHQKEPLKIRLLPNRSYPLPYHATCAEGHAPASSVVMAYNHAYEEPLKLLEPYEKGADTVLIYHPDDMDLEGKTLLIQKKDGHGQEFFRAAKKLDAEKNRYALSQPLADSYKKIGTKLYPVYLSHADKNGEYYLPVSGIHTQKAAFSFWLAENGKTGAEVTAELESGRVNRIDLL